MENTILKSFYSRLKKEGIIKAVLTAFSIAFSVLLVTATACWFTDFGGYWLCILTFAVSFGIAMPLLYRFKFKPTKKYVAKRIDKLGLEERILTMVEFENEDSYILRRQREDAEKTLQKYNSGLIKYVLSTSLIAGICLASVFGLGMTTVYGLSQADVLPSGKALIGNLTAKPAVEYKLVYKIPEEQLEFGTLYSASCADGTNELTLTVVEGKDGEVVRPVAKPGYVFIGWSDGYNGVYRKDEDVCGRIIVSALFEKIEFEFENDESEDGAIPGQKQNSSSSQNNNNSQEDSDKPPQQSGSAYTEDQFYKDGKTYYGGAPYQEALAEALEELSQSTGTDDDAKAGALDYLEAIERE